jgi:hypothetical protein
MARINQTLIAPVAEAASVTRAKIPPEANPSPSV